MSLLWDRMAIKGVNANGSEGVNPPTVAWKDAEYQIFDVQNVADYYHTHMFTEERSWEAKDAPNIAPPFDRFWMEFRHKQSHFEKDSLQYPDMGWGVAINAFDFESISSERSLEMEQYFNYIVSHGSFDYWRDGSCVDSELYVLDRHAAAWNFLAGVRRVATMQERLIRAIALRGLTPVRWMLEVVAFCEVGSKIGCVGHVIMFVTSEGQVYPTVRPSMEWSFVNRNALVAEIPEEEQAHQVFGSVVMPAFLAISFLHCKNVTTLTQIPPAKLSRAAQKRHGKPLVRYHTLEIEPMKQVLKHEGQSEKTGLRRALHITRGHFKHFEEKPLFGKVRGTFWWPSHVRGSLDEGIVDKDYRIKEPKA